MFPIHPVVDVPSRTYPLHHEKCHGQTKGCDCSLSGQKGSKDCRGVFRVWKARNRRRYRDTQGSDESKKRQNEWLI